MPTVRKRYSFNFKRAAVDRVAAGESPSAVARELGIRRKFLYAWKEAGFGTAAVAEGKKKEKREPHEIREEELKERIEKLEQLLGRQAMELDFFRTALRGVRGQAPNNGEPTALESTIRSNRPSPRKANRASRECVNCLG